jgi:hypothetical protein
MDEDNKDENLDEAMRKAFENPKEFYPAPEATPPAALGGATQESHVYGNLMTKIMKITSQDFSLGRCPFMLAVRFNPAKPRHNAKKKKNWDCLE